MHQEIEPFDNTQELSLPPNITEDRQTMFTVYSSPDCAWCTKAKKLLEEKGLAYVCESTKNPETMRIIRQMGYTTIPQIWDGSNYVGGFTELKDYLDG